MIYLWDDGSAHQTHSGFIDTAGFDPDEARYLIEAGGGLVIAQLEHIKVFEPSLLEVTKLIDWVQPNWLFEMDGNKVLRPVPNAAWMHLTKPTLKLLTDHWYARPNFDRAHVVMWKTGCKHIDEMVRSGGWSLPMIKQLLQCPLPWQDIHAQYGVDEVDHSDWAFMQGYRFEAWTPDGSETEVCRTLLDVVSIIEQWTGVDLYERLHGEKTRKIGRAFDEAVDELLPPGLDAENERLVRRVGVYQLLRDIRLALLDKVRRLDKDSL